MTHLFKKTDIKKKKNDKVSLDIQYMGLRFSIELGGGKAMKKSRLFFIILILAFIFASIVAVAEDGWWVFLRGTTKTYEVAPGHHIYECDCTASGAKDCTCAIWVPNPAF